MDARTPAPSIPTPTLALLAALLLMGCGRDAPTTGTVMEDSAGITVAVARAPAWEEGRGWRVASTPRVEIGRTEGPGPEVLSDVVGAVRLSDGRIVVADRGSGELRLFDATGAFLDRVGGEGEGPGEFRSLDFLGRLAGDTLVTWDGRIHRVQLFGADGTFLRSFTVDPPGGPETVLVPDHLVGVVDGRRLVLELGDFSRPSEGVVDWPPELLATVDPVTGAVDTVGRFRGPQAQVSGNEEGGYSHGTVAFARHTGFGAGAGRLAVIDTERWEVRILDPEGRLRRVLRRPVEPQPVTRTRVDELVEGVVEVVYPEPDQAPAGQVERLRTMWRERPRAETIPLLRSVHLDAEGNIWVEPYFDLGASPAPFQVFDPGGRWLGPVEMPAGLARGFHPRLAPRLELGEDWVLGVWTDELGVERVRLYDLLRQPRRAQGDEAGPGETPGAGPDDEGG